MAQPTEGVLSSEESANTVQSSNVHALLKELEAAHALIRELQDARASDAVMVRCDDHVSRNGFPILVSRTSVRVLVTL